MVTSWPVSVMVKRPSRVITVPAGVSMPNQASPWMAKSNGLPVSRSGPLMLEMKVSPDEAKEIDLSPSPDTTSSNFTPVARKPTVEEFATLSAIVFSRLSSATWEESAT